MNGKKVSKWRAHLADALELPREIILNLPRVTVIGSLQCYLENHRGVIEYTEECVRVAIDGGELIVDGQDLIIRYLADDEIAIDGHISAIRFEN
ncbi:MAG: sporulation protein YqfC [Firmicutes bacterium]|nr:sporulation protein YqfC [Bacillota bacterium]